MLIAVNKRNNKNGYAWCDVFVDWCFFKAFGKTEGQEGNASDMVKKTSYSLSNSYVAGFGHPRYDEAAPAAPAGTDSGDSGVIEAPVNAGAEVTVKLAMLAICGTAVVRDPPAPTGEISWEDMDPAQLSWVIEGIQERISALQDDLARANWPWPDRLPINDNAPLCMCREGRFLLRSVL